MTHLDATNLTCAHKLTDSTQDHKTGKKITTRKLSLIEENKTNQVELRA